MTNINLVVVAGNVTRDPELRYTASGSAVCDVGLALHRRYQSAGGELQEETSFVEVVVWGKQAEAVAAHMAKGRALLVEGRLQQDSWETETGERHSRVKVVAHRVSFLGGNGARSTEASDREEG